jgi:hypothetical protein
VVGRIIHSKETNVVYRKCCEVVCDGATGRSHDITQPVAFGFSSDRDSRVDHYVDLQALVTPYVGGISSQIADAIKARNDPA